MPKKNKKQLIGEVINLLKKCLDILYEVNQLIPDEAEPVVESTKEASPTLEEVRTLLADLSRRGYTSNVKMMLVGLGVDKLSDVDPKDYPELMAKAKELDDATKD